ncbi:hypothetical protein NMY22_g3793 [Coprinellus aureogranulatus]|nr:hypothetical protein NMY22_g3793 [Coprinellus aureogranulatus]
MPDNEAAGSVRPDKIAEGERLKALGNDAYSKGNNEEAYRLYSEAIDKDPGNAVYYANRAAALLGQKRYLAAVRDCEKVGRCMGWPRNVFNAHTAQAVEIDPTYYKAWQRLGTAAQALTLWEKAINAYESALKSFPTTLSAGDEKLKQKCKQALSTTKALKPLMPWEMAKGLADRKKAKVASCVYALNTANFDFESGLSILARNGVVQSSVVMMMMQHEPGTLMHLTNAILRDDRVYRAAIRDFPSRMATAVASENLSSGGWGSTEDVALVKRELQFGIQTRGWDSVRRSNETTIR